MCGKDLNKREIGMERFVKQIKDYSVNEKCTNKCRKVNEKKTTVRYSSNNF